MYARSLSVLSVFRVGEKARNVGAATPLDRGETEASSSWGEYEKFYVFGYAVVLRVGQWDGY